MLSFMLRYSLTTPLDDSIELWAYVYMIPLDSHTALQFVEWLDYTACWVIWRMLTKLKWWIK